MAELHKIKRFRLDCVHMHVALCLALLFSTFLASNRAYSAGSFDGLNGPLRGERRSSYLQNWGPPDLFMASHLLVKAPKAPQSELQLWVYCKQGVELTFRDENIVRAYYFDPQDGKNNLPSGSKLNPDEFFHELMEPEDIKKKFGQPSQVKTKKIGDVVLLTYEYNQDGNKIFGFTDNVLTFVSSGFRKNMKNPWYLPANVNHGGNPTKVLGAWKSKVGNFNFNASPNTASFPGQIVIPADVLDKALGAGVGTISEASFNPGTNFLKFAYRTNHTDGHGEFILSPDGKTLTGSLFGQNEWDCWPVQLTR